MSSDQSEAPGSLSQLLILSGSFFFLFLGVGALQQFLVPILSTRAEMSDAAASAVFACVYLAGPIFLSVYSHVFQAIGARWCIILGSCTYTLFAAVLLLFPHPIAILGAAVIWGFGAETIWATGPTQVINTSAQSRFGSVSGIFQSGTYLGQMLGVLMLGTIARSYGGPAQAAAHVPMLAVAVALPALGNLLALFIRVKPTERPPARLTDAFRALQLLPARYLIVLSVATYLAWGLILSSFAVLVKDIGQEAKLHWIVLPYYAGRLLVAWLAGRASDKVGRERVMMAGFVLGTGSLVAAAFSPTAPTIAVVSAILGMQAAMVSVASTAAVGDYIAPSDRHLVFAGTNAWGYLAAGGTMVLSPVLREVFANFAPSFLVIAALYGGCAILVARMRVALRAVPL